MKYILSILIAIGFVGCTTPTKNELSRTPQQEVIGEVGKDASSGMTDEQLLICANKEARVYIAKILGVSLEQKAHVYDADILFAQEVVYQNQILRLQPVWKTLNDIKAAAINTEAYKNKYSESEKYNNPNGLNDTSLALNYTFNANLPNQSLIKNTKSKHIGNIKITDIFCKQK